MSLIASTNKRDVDDSPCSGHTMVLNELWNAVKGNKALYQKHQKKLSDLFLAGGNARKYIRKVKDEV